MASKKTDCCVCEKHKPLQFVQMTQAAWEGAAGVLRSTVYGLTADGAVYSYHPGKRGWVALEMHQVD